MPPQKKMERETRFELATSTLARLHSTTELFPLKNVILYLNIFPGLVKRKFDPCYQGISPDKGLLSSVFKQPSEPHEIIDSRPEGNGQGDPEDNIADNLEIDSEKRVMNQKRNDRRNLETGFELAQLGCGYVLAALDDDIAQPVDGKLPADNNADHPAGTRSNGIIMIKAVDTSS